MERKGNKRTLVGFAVLVFIAAAIFMVSWSQGDPEPDVRLYDHERQEVVVLPMEEYIQGVVAGEMLPDWPVEAYAAQAIFARSFTMALMEEGKFEDQYGADITTDIYEAQAYDRAGITDAIRQGVEQTRGQVMLYEEQFVKGWFHAYSGGETAPAWEGLDYQYEEPPYIISRQFPENPYVDEEAAAWSAVYSGGELQQLLADTVNVGELTDIQVTERGPTQRVTQIKLVGTTGSETISGPVFRNSIGSTRMRSTLVDEFVWEEGSLTMSGVGYGHGVGLSQWDAYQMAEDGESAERIVAAFFRDVEIEKLWD